MFKFIAECDECGRTRELEWDLGQQFGMVTDRDTFLTYHQPLDGGVQALCPWCLEKLG